MKILLFIKLPPPLTGATIMNHYIVNSELILRKFDIKKISISYKNEINDKYKYSLNKVFTIIVLHFKLIKNIITFKPQIIYFPISPLGIAFIRDCTYVLWLKIFTKHIVYHLHGKGIKNACEKFKIMKFFYRWAFKGSSVICLSNTLVDDIASVYSGVPYIVNNGIPILADSFERSYKKNTTVNVLFLSNLLYSKGITVLLDALVLLDSNYRDKVKVNIVGKEAELSKAKLNEEILRRGISNFVDYIGPKYGDEKNNIYQNTDILVYPTLNDVWGLVILEAMQHGLPVIASKEGAIPEIVDDGVSGFLVDKNNPEQIVSKIKILIDDPKLRHNMGLQGYSKFTDNYTLDIFERNIVNVFDSIYSKLEQ